MIYHPFISEDTDSVNPIDGLARFASLFKSGAMFKALWPESQLGPALLIYRLKYGQAPELFVVLESLEGEPYKSVVPGVWPGIYMGPVPEVSPFLEEQDNDDES